MAGCEAETHCYNKGCGKKYLPSKNIPEACTYHPGEPVFHDAYKGWSCCKKRVIDFTEFLNIKGCYTGLHSNEKPPDKPKPPPISEEEKAEVIVVKAPKQRLPDEQPIERPSDSEPLIPLPLTVTSSLKSALEKLTVDTTNDEKEEISLTDDVATGTPCKNVGCKQVYSGVQSNYENCMYHAGKAIFHEGMKYWSCCQRKTSDFNSFLAQEGCTFGSHLWVVKKDMSKLVHCRYDWHQTSSHVVLSIYCKNAQQELSSVEANRVLMNVSITFNQSKNQFRKIIALEGTIDPAQSTVHMFGSKCEVKLKKIDFFAWKRYELPQAAAEETENSTAH